MPIRTLALARAHKGYILQSPTLDLTAPISAQPIGTVLWDSKIKGIYLTIVSTDCAGDLVLDVGYSANSRTRSKTAVITHFVNQVTVRQLYLRCARSCISLTVTNDNVEGGDIITFTGDGGPAGTLTGYIEILLWPTGNCKEEAQWGDVITTTTTTSTTSSTTSSSTTSTTSSSTTSSSSTSSA